MTGFGWTPIGRDDHFYNNGDDVKAKYDRGEVNTGVNLVIGFNSYEASFLQPYMTALAYSTVDEILAILNYGFGLFSFVDDLNEMKSTELTLSDHYDELLNQF